MEDARSNAHEALLRLQAVVEELTSAKPEAGRIKARMREAGIRYCADPVARVQAVLEALSAEHIDTALDAPDGRRLR